MAAAAAPSSPQSQSSELESRVLAVEKAVAEIREQSQQMLHGFRALEQQIASLADSIHKTDQFRGETRVGAENPVIEQQSHLSDEVLENGAIENNISGDLETMHQVSLVSGDELTPSPAIFATDPSLGMQDDASGCATVAGSEGVVDFTSTFTTDMVFQSRQSLVEWIQDTGKRNGLVIVIKSSEVGGDGRKPRITFACERSGSYRTSVKNHESRKRTRAMGSKKCGCPFEVKGFKLRTDDDWKIQVVCGVHNHPNAQNVVHTFAGRLSEEEKNILISMSKSLVKPKEILNTLKQRDAHNSTTIKAIYNARQKYKVAKKCAKSQEATHEIELG